MVLCVLDYHDIIMSPPAPDIISLFFLSLFHHLFIYSNTILPFHERFFSLTSPNGSLNHASVARHNILITSPPAATRRARVAVEASYRFGGGFMFGFN